MEMYVRLTGQAPSRLTILAAFLLWLSPLHLSQKYIACASRNFHVLGNISIIHVVGGLRGICRVQKMTTLAIFLFYLLSLNGFFSGFGLVVGQTLVKE